MKATTLHLTVFAAVMVVLACTDTTEPEQVPAQLLITPDTATIVVDSTIQLSVTALNAYGRAIHGVAVAWTSSDAAVAAVSEDGAMRGLAPGEATITASHDSISASARVTVWPRVGGFVFSRDELTMVPTSVTQIGLTILDSRGDTVTAPAVTWSSSDIDVVEVSAEGWLWAKAEGTARVVATAYGHADSVPVTVTLIEIVSLAVGDTRACGLTPDGQAFCWGQSGLGDGLDQPSLLPVQVAGGHTFTRLSDERCTCGLTAEGEVYCWGLGGFGQLGHGSVVDVSLVPVRVASDEHFVDITCGSYHACGATAGGTAYCWGDENSGKLGNGAEWDGYAEPQPTPLPVVGGHSFVSISAAYNHTCAVTAEGKAYCWGSNRYGQLGNGEGSGVYTSPVAAVSERSFKIVRAGSHDFTCGVTLDDTLLCWGHNDLSQLGRGTDTKEELIPESPVGLSTAIAVDGAWAHTCAIATDGSAYCWGQCARCGKLGDGQFASSMVPVPVAGGLTFKSIDTGGDTSCGVTVDDRGYCWGWNFMLGDQTECWGVPTRVPGQRSWSWP